MKIMTRISINLAICLLLLSQICALPQFTRDEDNEEPDDDTDEEEDTDDVYDEEGAASTTGKPEEDKDEKEDRLAREKIAYQLGIKNFSGAAIADKAAALVVRYLSLRYPQQQTPRPRKKVKAEEPVAITTKKYKIFKMTTSLPPEISTVLVEQPTSQPEVKGHRENNGTSQIRTFVITVPHGMNGTGGGARIEINIPMPMITKPMEKQTENVSKELSDHHHTQMSISSPDEQGVKNIEAAIMEALIIAQQMASMNMSTSSTNNTEVIELDIGNLKQVPDKDEESTTIEQGENMMDTFLNVTASSSPQEDVGPPPSPAVEATAPPLPPTSRPKRKRPTRASTTTPRGPTPDDPYAVGPVTDLVVSQIRTGQLPQFLWGSLMKLAKSEYAQIAVDAVECAVFYYCPDDTELGTLSKGGAF